MSVLVPTHQGERYVERALDSLAKQTLRPELFEIIVVQNGPATTTPQLVRAFAERHPSLSVRLIEQTEPGAARARNVGLAAARGSYITFVDDDDLVSPGYLEALAKAAEPDVVAVAQIADVPDGDGPARLAEGTYDNYFSSALEPLSGQTVSAEELPAALALNAAKLVSADLARAHAYQTDLRSGEDFVYWATLFASRPFRVRVVPRQEATYYRVVRDGSVSRQAVSYEFNVLQRLECISALGRLPDSDERASQIVSRMRASQLWMINRYLREHPEDHAKAHATIDEMQLSVEWRRLNAGLANELAILYCFPPFVDTSGFVAARRIREAGVLTDVISQDMSNVRERDPGSRVIADPLVARHRVLKGNATWASWKEISHYIRRVQAVIPEMEERNGHPYERIYSRSMWAPSTLAAALLKSRRPELHWRAEFSDPLHYDVNRRIRGSLMKEGPIARELREAMKSAGFAPPPNLRIFEWCEQLAYALADEVVFTNENQREYMLDYCLVPELVTRARARSVVEHHPTLPSHFYHVAESEYPLDPDRVHVGYFGMFYVNRGITEVTDALRLLDQSERERVQLHVFTSDPYRVTREVKDAGLGDMVVASPYRPYLEFLNLTTRFDALIVNDAATSEHHHLNPYLPSKLSDYLGSGTSIWKICEPGSVLSTIETSFTSALADVDGAHRVLQEMLSAYAGPAAKRTAQRDLVT